MVITLLLGMTQHEHSLQAFVALDLFRMPAPVGPGARYLMAHRPGPVKAQCIFWLHLDPLQAVSLARVQLPWIFSCGYTSTFIQN